MTSEIDKVLTVDEVAKIRGVGHEAIMTAIRKEKLKATFFHGKWHIRESSLREYYGVEEREEWLSLDEAVKRTQISSVLLMRAIDTKALPVLRSKGNNIKIRVSDLQEWTKINLEPRKHRKTSCL